jgi:hypothetical protein
MFMPQAAPTGVAFVLVFQTYYGRRARTRFIYDPSGPDKGVTLDSWKARCIQYAKAEGLEYILEYIGEVNP